MEKKELVKSVLEKNGYKTRLDETTGCLYIIYQMKYMYISVVEEEDDFGFVAVMLPCIYRFYEDDKTKVLQACNQFNQEFKIVKVFVDKEENLVSAEYQFHFDTEKNLQKNLDDALELMGMIKTIFKELVD